ncbi:MAG: helix-turn-helix domain-containing protein [Candidatus Dormibacteria bacterium]
MNSTEVGIVLGRARRQADVSQAELAIRLGTSQPAVSRAESGAVMPSLEFIDRWAVALGIPVTLTMGMGANTEEGDARQRVKQALGGYTFNPWTRSPSAAERRSLKRDGLTREYFERAIAASTRESG